MVKFEGHRLELELKQHSPLIHFQADDVGATLRASEVKPKLDTYLMKCVSLKDSCKINPTQSQALAYKMKIIATTSSSRAIDEREYRIFYGNQAVPAEKHKKFIFTETRIIITCFIDELRKAIEKHIADFFIVTNFGTMQHKGFGSFTVNENPVRKNQEIKNLLNSTYNSDIYYMDLPNSTHVAKFRAIHAFYQLTKSGINFRGYARSALFLYMHKKYNLGNEKAKVKVSNIIDRPSCPNEKQAEHRKTGTSHQHQFVRALLGVGTRMDFEPRNRNSDYVHIESDSIARMASPLRFKIIGDIVYIYAVPLSENIFNQTFTFSRQAKGQKNLSSTTPRFNIETPNQTSFDIQEFLAFSCAYYNYCRKKARNTKDTSQFLYDGKTYSVFGKLPEQLGSCPPIN